MKKFIFEIPIEMDEYSPETCKRDYGSKKNYNSDFPEHVYAAEVMQKLISDARANCFTLLFEALENKKNCLTDEAKASNARLTEYARTRKDFYDELESKIKYVRSEQI